jgi:glycosyltransferase involved in cell wall biosynthesis
MKIALVHDYLTQLGGAEKVLENLTELYPASPVFVLVQNKGKTGLVFPPSRIRTSWLKYFPLAGKNHHWYLTLMPRATESHNLNEFQVILSSASSIAKGVRLSDDSIHICYCHTPTRYLWHDEGSYVEELQYNKLVKKVIPLFLKRLKNWDLLASDRVDFFIANSRVVQDRIKKYYNRDSTVIYPPVEIDKFHISEKPDDYFLIGGRLVAYKKYDLAIEAFNRLGIKLKIFGGGPDYKRLKKMARENIEFIGPVSDSDKAKLYSKALAFIHPQLEDFGITAIESMASGRPVIAYAAGGALETVVSGVTGEFFDSQTWESLVHAILKFDSDKFNPADIRAHAYKFDRIRFKREIKDYVNLAIRSYQVENVFRIK